MIKIPGPDMNWAAVQYEEHEKSVEWIALQLSDRLKITISSKTLFLKLKRMGVAIRTVSQKPILSDEIVGQALLLHFGDEELSLCEIGRRLKVKTQQLSAAFDRKGFQARPRIPPIRKYAVRFFFPNHTAREYIYPARTIKVALLAAMKDIKKQNIIKLEIKLNTKKKMIKLP